MFNDFDILVNSNAKLMTIQDSSIHPKSFLYCTTIDMINNEDDLLAKFPNVKRWMALSRFNTYWMQPSFGQKLSDVPAETQFLIIETTDGNQQAIVPLAYDDFAFTLQGDEDDDNDVIRFTQKNYIPNEKHKKDNISVALIVVDNYEIMYHLDYIANMINYLSNKSFVPRIYKKRPDFTKKLGWCTWDAFYHEVDKDKVLTGVESMITDNIKAGYIIIDDGWLDVKGDYLNSFAPNNKKFGDNFIKILTLLISNDIELGVWHNLNGYWGGINKNGELADQYRLIENENFIRPWDGDKDKKIPLYLVDPQDISRFYLDWYRQLAILGVKIVKVDGQSGLELFTAGKYNKNFAMRRYQEAMQSAAGLFFKNNVIHCMSHGNDVFQNLLTTNVVRNSDDYLPGKPREIQQKHIFANAMNAIYTSLFAIPDWDMFKSGSAEGDFHAAARAISGGPVYICDKPNEYDTKIVNRLIADDGSILSPKDIALPLPDRIFIDCLHEKKLLIIRNYTEFGVVLGIFNVNVNGIIITETVDVSAYMPDEMENDIIFFKAIKGNCGKLKKNGNMTFKLKPMTYEIVYFTEMMNGVAPLGAVEKYIGSAAIDTFDREEGAAIINLKISGDFIVYSEKEPSVVTLNFEPVDFLYNHKDKAVTITMDTFNHYKEEFFLFADEEDEEELPETVALSLIFQDEIMNKLDEIRYNYEEDDDDDELFDFDDNGLFNDNFISDDNNINENKEDMLKMIKEVMERMEADGEDDKPLRLLPPKKGDKQKQ